MLNKKTIIFLYIISIRVSSFFDLKENTRKEECRGVCRRGNVTLSSSWKANKAHTDTDVLRVQFPSDCLL